MNLNSFIAYRNVNANSNCAHEIENKKPNFFYTAFSHNLKVWGKEMCFFLFYVLPDGFNMVCIP